MNCPPIVFTRPICVAMGNNYNIQRNLPEPSREEVEQFQDFESLLAAFEQSKTMAGVAPPSVDEAPARGPLRLAWIAIPTAIAAAVALLLWNQSASSLPSPTEAAQVADAYFKTVPALSPPIKELNPARLSAKVVAEAGGEIALANGVRLVVPKMAFQNDRGKLIESGEVDIFYREMHDIAEFFMAGVPLTYDSAGVKHQLRSVGMVEIIGLQNGRPVKIAEGKSIQVELAASMSEEQANATYKVYHLDTLNRQWEYRGLSKGVFEVENSTTPSAKPQSPNLAEQNWLARNPAPVAPLRPAKPNGKSITFELDPRSDIPVESGSEEAVASLQKGAIWQVNTPGFDERALGVEWKSMRLRKINELEYAMTLIHDLNEVKLTVQPVLVGKDFERANGLYEAALKKYEQDLANWQNQKDAFLATQNTETITETETPKRSSRKRKAVFSFQVNEFGFWDCDLPAPLSVNSIRISQVEDQTGATFPNQRAYLADRQSGMVQEIHTGKGNTLHFDPQAENLLWLVTPDGQLAILDQAQLQTLAKKGKKTVTLRLKRQKVAPRTAAELRGALGIK